MKKLIFTFLLITSFCYLETNATQTLIRPGIGAAVSKAVDMAASGDTIVLYNDSVYSEVDTIRVKKKITIMAQRLRKLPELAGMPKLLNNGTRDPLFNLYNNADLILIGIDIDNKGAMDIIRANDKDSTDGTYKITIDRCRMHNCTFVEKDKGGMIGYPSDKMVVKYKKNLRLFKLTNSIIYDMGNRSCYFKNWTGEGQVIIENNTFYNIGQQSFYIKWLDDGTNTAKEKLVFMYNHNTNYLISSNAGFPKEILGNATGQTYASTFPGLTPKPLAPFIADIKNSIFVKQVSTNPSTLTGQPTSMGANTALLTNEIRVTKNIFIGTVIQLADQTGLKFTEPSDVYPDFTDTAARNFTVNNTAITTLADDNKTLGALYWDKNFKDVDIVTNAKLLTIKVDGLPVAGFKGATLAYNYELAKGTTAIPVVAVEADDDKATVQVTQAADVNGKATIKVTAQDGTTIKTYEVTFKVAAELSKVADLGGIEYDGTAVSNFAKETLEYTVALPEDQIDIPIVTATKGIASQKFVITQATDLPGTATIVVTAEDGTTTKTYKVNYVLSNAVNNMFIASASVYPNPVSENGAIHFNLKTSSNVQIDIVGLNGQVMQHVLKSAMNSGAYTTTFNASQLKNGVYVVRVSANGNASYLKLIKR